MKLKSISVIISILLSLCICLCGCVSSTNPKENSNLPVSSAELENLKPSSDSPYTEIDKNTPSFAFSAISTKPFEHYSNLDSLGRCGVAEACVGVETMPTEERGTIGQVKPSGWDTVKYDIVDGKYLYNRCHLIGFQLTGENANEKNLITGTRYLNVEGMLPFENMVADYVKETGNHVLYRVTPVYKDKNLVANGVHMEAWSIEDKGAGISFNVFVHNVQPGISINYATGESRLGENADFGDTSSTQSSVSYVLNTNTKKFHRPSCPNVKDIKPQNKKDSESLRESIIKDGYIPCKSCNP